MGVNNGGNGRDYSPPEFGVRDANTNCSQDFENTAQNSPKHTTSNAKFISFSEEGLCPEPSLLDLPVRSPHNSSQIYAYGSH